MSGFYKKAVVWLGLNEEYPDGGAMHPDDEYETVAPIERGPNDGAPQDSLGPRIREPEAMTAPGPGPGPDKRGAEQRGPRPKPEPQQTPRDPLKANASYDRSEGTVRAIPVSDDPAPSEPSQASGAAGGGATGRRVQEPSTGTVRAVPMPKTTKPQVIEPQSFNDAQDVADMFRDKQPVIVNMQNAERDLARRLIDFSSGLCYGLGGQMEKVAKDVYLLTPTDVEVAAADRDIF